jgi:hypothetical protein
MNAESTSTSACAFAKRLPTGEPAQSETRSLAVEAVALDDEDDVATPFAP